MPTIYLHLVRHAQGFHNLCIENHVLPDPLLTSLGEAQCHELSKAFPYTSQITHLIASPLRRTIYTTLLSFPSLIHTSSSSKGLQILALPEIQETSQLPCDTGSSIPVLESEFNSPTSKYNGAVNFSLLTPSWNSKKGIFSPSAKAIEARAMTARKYIRQLGQEALRDSKEDIHIVAVTHGGFLHYFTEDFEGAINDGTVGTGWQNTEFRSYTFADHVEADASSEGTEGMDRASITETKESRTRRKRHEPPLTKSEQMKLKAGAEREWGKSGYQNKDDEGESAEEVARL